MIHSSQASFRIRCAFKLEESWVMSITDVNWSIVDVTTALGETSLPMLAEGIKAKK